MSAGRKLESRCASSRKRDRVSLEPTTPVKLSRMATVLCAILSPSLSFLWNSVEKNWRGGIGSLSTSYGISSSASSPRDSPETSKLNEVSSSSGVTPEPPSLADWRRPRGDWVSPEFSVIERLAMSTPRDWLRSCGDRVSCVLEMDGKLGVRNGF